MSVVHDLIAKAQARRFSGVLRFDRSLQANLVHQPHTDAVENAELQLVLPDSYIDELAGRYGRRFSSPQSRHYRKATYRKAAVEIPPVHPPSGDAYEKKLKQQILTPLFKSLREALSEAAGASQAYYALQNLPPLEIGNLHAATVKNYFNQLADKHRDELIRIFREALGVEVGVLLQDGPIRQALDERVLENVSLIRTIPPSVHDSLKAHFLQLLHEAPFDRSRIADVLKKEYGSTGYKLRRIARDQTSKAIGQFTELRQGQCGITHYRWLSSNDERVRPTHVENNGKTFAWAEPPEETGHPGWDIQCRCTAVAIIPEHVPEEASVEVVAETPQQRFDFSGVDSAWAALKADPTAFTFVRDARKELGGAHPKFIYADKDGNKWLFKPGDQGTYRWVAHGEEAAYLIARNVNPDTIEVRVIELDGKIGTIQKLIPTEDINPSPNHDFARMKANDFTTEEIEKLQKEHVIEWMVSNHDPHWDNFIRMKDGRVLGIDRGQAYKYIGKDRLDIDYLPHTFLNGASETVYNTIFRGVKDKKISFNPHATLEAIKRIEALSDEELKAILKPYAEGKSKTLAGQQEFYDLVLARKNNIRRDIEIFYREILEQPSFRFIDTDPSVTAEKSELAQFLEEVEDLGIQGKTMAIDAEDIEDQNALVFTDEFNYRPRTIIKLKVRDQANHKIIRKIHAVRPPDINEMVTEDRFSLDIQAAIRTVKGNIKYNPDQVNLYLVDMALRHEDELRELDKSADSDVQGMARLYLRFLQSIDKSVETGEDLIQGSAKDALYLKKNAGLPPNLDANFAVSRSEIRHIKRKPPKQGVTEVINEISSNKEMFYNPEEVYLRPGLQYNMIFDDDMRVLYRPTHTNNTFAQRGELEIVIPGEPNAANVEKALDHLRELGLSADPPTSEDEELMYLQKAAYSANVHRSNLYELSLRNLSADSSKAERIQAMKDYWGQILEVKDVATLPSYNPKGEHQAAFGFPGRTGGYRQHMRFDITDDDLEAEMGDYFLYHELTAGKKNSMADFVSMVLSGNGSMIATTEKMRVGVEARGLSPDEDMGTGGGSYFFTRIQQGGTQPRYGLQFKKKLLRRMDAISYDNDYYGQVSEDFPSQYRYSTMDGWKKDVATRPFVNETILKHNVMLLENIEYFVVNDEEERQATVDALYMYGITEMPDGRSVEEVVWNRYESKPEPSSKTKVIEQQYTLYSTEGKVQATGTYEEILDGIVAKTGLSFDYVIANAQMFDIKTAEAAAPQAIDEFTTQYVIKDLEGKTLGVGSTKGEATVEAAKASGVTKQELYEMMLAKPPKVGKPLEVPIAEITFGSKGWTKSEIDKIKQTVKTYMINAPGEFAEADAMQKYAVESGMLIEDVAEIIQLQGGLATVILDVDDISVTKPPEAKEQFVFYQNGKKVVSFDAKEQEEETPEEDGDDAIYTLYGFSGDKKGTGSYDEVIEQFAEEYGISIAGVESSIINGNISIVEEKPVDDKPATGAEDVYGSGKWSKADLINAYKGFKSFHTKYSYMGNIQLIEEYASAEGVPYEEMEEKLGLHFGSIVTDIKAFGLSHPEIDSQDLLGVYANELEGISAVDLMTISAVYQDIAIENPKLAEQITPVAEPVEEAPTEVEPTETEVSTPPKPKVKPTDDGPKYGSGQWSETTLEFVYKDFETFKADNSDLLGKKAILEYAEQEALTKEELYEMLSVYQDIAGIDVQEAQAFQSAGQVAVAQEAEEDHMALYSDYGEIYAEGTYSEMIAELAYLLGVSEEDAEEKLNNEESEGMYIAEYEEPEDDW